MDLNAALDTERIMQRKPGFAGTQGRVVSAMADQWVLIESIENMRMAIDAASRQSAKRFAQTIVGCQRLG